MSLLYTIACRLRHHRGEDRWMAVPGAPVFTSDGTLQSWFGTDRHNAELASQAQELTQLNVLLTQTIASVGSGTTFQFRWSGSTSRE